MVNLKLSNLIKFKGNQYLLQTSDNGFGNKIVCSLFKSGELINSKEKKYDPDFSEDTLWTMINELHNKTKHDLEILFDLSEGFSNSNTPEILNMTGLAFLRHKLYDGAIEEFYRAIEIDPTNGKSYKNLGETYFLIKEYDKAINALEKAVNLCPEYADIHNILGKAYLKKKFCKKAAEEFERAININVYYGEAYFNLGLAYILNAITKEVYSLTVNLYKNTMEKLGKACSINPAYKNEYFIQGDRFLKDDKLEEAFDMFYHAQDSVSTSNIKKYSIDFYLKVLNSKDEIEIDMIWDYIKNCKELIKKYPGYADLYNDLGIANAVLSILVNTQAIKNFEEAKNINDDFKEAQRNLKLTQYENRGYQLFLNAIMGISSNDSMYYEATPESSEMSISF